MAPQVLNQQLINLAEYAAWSTHDGGVMSFPDFAERHQGETLEVEEWNHDKKYVIFKDVPDTNPPAPAAQGPS